MLKNSYFALRHGKNIYQEENKDLIYPKDGVNKVILSDFGIKEVKEVSKEIKKADIDKIYSSDFLRTKQTAEIVKEEIGFEREIIFDKRLRDLDLGVWHEKKKTDFLKEFPIEVESFNKRPEEGESWADLKKRILDIINQIEEKNNNKKILIISHGDPLWILEAIIKGESMQDIIIKRKDRKKLIKTGEFRKLN